MMRVLVVMAIVAVLFTAFGLLRGRWTRAGCGSCAGGDGQEQGCGACALRDACALDDTEGAQP